MSQGPAQPYFHPILIFLADADGIPFIAASAAINMNSETNCGKES